MKQFKSHHAKKRLSQHWLIDRNILGKMLEASALTPADHVIEIGTGTGFLTEALAKTAAQVISYDIDASAQAVAKKNLAAYSQIEFVHRDMLAEPRPYAEIAHASACKVIANIPYKITSPIIDQLSKNKSALTLAVIMVQKEVGDRMVAFPGTSEYGAFSVFCQYHFRVEKIWRVSKSCFVPPPDVESMIVRLTPHPAPPVALQNEAIFFKLVRAIFLRRRKTLKNCLVKSPELGLTAEMAETILADVGISPLERGEKLSLSALGMLANRLARDKFETPSDL